MKLQKKLLIGILALTASQSCCVYTNEETQILYKTGTMEQVYINRGSITNSQALHFKNHVINRGTIKAKAIFLDKNLTGRYGHCEADIMVANHDCKMFEGNVIKIAKALYIHNPRTEIVFNPSNTKTGKFFKGYRYMGNIECNATNGITVTDYSDILNPNPPSYTFKGSWDNLCKAMSEGVTKSRSLKGFLLYLEQLFVDSKNKRKLTENDCDSAKKEKKKSIETDEEILQSLHTFVIN